MVTAGFAEILKELIEDKGLSLRKLSVDSNVSANQYSKYLRGTIPTVAVAIKIADYFNCSLDYLFGLTTEKGHKSFKAYNITLFVPRYLQLLRENNISHWKFSKEYNLSESNLRHWENGDIPRIDNLITIAHNLSCSIDYLIGRTNLK